MAVIEETTRKATRASLYFRFGTTDVVEAEEILKDLQRVLTDRMEYHGFASESLVVHTVIQDAT